MYLHPPFRTFNATFAHNMKINSYLCTRNNEQNDSEMCKFKDTTLGIKKLDFNVKRGAMAAYLTDGREVIVPVSMFPDIKRLSRKEREDWMIMDDQYFSFEALSRIYSVKDLLKI